ncbi:unnamed protein product [Trichobilharzia regenti]|nr:unnamed protein product [Trichobilharzia regenti]
MPQDAVADNTSLEVHLQEVAIEPFQSPGPMPAARNDNKIIPVPKSCSNINLKLKPIAITLPFLELITLAQP